MLWRRWYRTEHSRNVCLRKRKKGKKEDNTTGGWAPNEAKYCQPRWRRPGGRGNGQASKQQERPSIPLVPFHPITDKPGPLCTAPCVPPTQSLRAIAHWLDWQALQGMCVQACVQRACGGGPHVLDVVLAAGRGRRLSPMPSNGLHALQIQQSRGKRTSQGASQSQGARAAVHRGPCRHRPMACAGREGRGGGGRTAGQEAMARRNLCPPPVSRLSSLLPSLFFPFLPLHPDSKCVRRRVGCCRVACHPGQPERPITNAVILCPQDCITRYVQHVWPYNTKPLLLISTIKCECSTTSVDSRTLPPETNQRQLAKSAPWQRHARTHATQGNLLSAGPCPHKPCSDDPSRAGLAAAALYTCTVVFRTYGAYVRTVVKCYGTYSHRRWGIFLALLTHCCGWVQVQRQMQS